MRTAQARRAKPGSDEALNEVDAHGRGFHQITHCRARCRGDGEADWSPDGTRIVSGRATGPRSAPGPSLLAIYIVNANGSHVRRISTPPHGYEDHYPTFSPDGRTVVFQRDTSTAVPGQTKLIAVDVVTRRERLAYRIPKWAPGTGTATYSPNGKQILFGYGASGDSRPPSTRDERNATLATIHPDGTALHRLHLRTGAESGEWSPDDTQIVFRCRSANPTAPPPPCLPPLASLVRVCTTKLDGTGFRTLPMASKLRRAGLGHPPMTSIAARPLRHNHASDSTADGLLRTSTSLAAYRLRFSLRSTDRTPTRRRCTARPVRSERSSSTRRRTTSNTVASTLLLAQDAVAPVHGFGPDPVREGESALLRGRRSRHLVLRQSRRHTRADRRHLRSPYGRREGWRAPRWSASMASA